ncbi:MAG: HIT family protein [bacterium]|nr:HIT family protein [bacterium]
MNENCVFCKIISGEIETNKVYEDDDTLAFLDISPLNPGHTLVVPKEHSRNILEISDESYRAVASTCHKVAEAIKEGLEPDGINVHMNNESAAGQLVFHTHIHVIPRYANDGYMPWHKKNYSKEEIELAGEKIKLHL